LPQRWRQSSILQHDKLPHAQIEAGAHWLDRSMNDNFYHTTATPFPALPALEGELRADVAVLGGGLTGLSAALELAEAGYSVVLLEAERIGWGASGRSGGQIIAGYGCEQPTLESQLGPSDARRLFDWSVEAVDLVQQRIARHAIACDWQPGHVHVAIKPRHVSELKRWQGDMAQAYDYPTQWWDRPQLQGQLASPRYLGGLFDARSGHLHPLNYTLGVARAALGAGVRICEQSRVTRIERGAQPALHTSAGCVRANFLVLAGNAYVNRLAPQMHARVMPVGTYIAATEPLGEARARALICNGMAVADTNWALDYFRLSSDHRLLFGGRASYSTFEPPTLRAVMLGRMRKVFPQLADVRFQHLWGGYLAITANRAPDWGRLAPNIYYAQGYSGHGMAVSGLAGRVIAEAIRGQAERLDVYARIRHLPFPGGRFLRTPLLVAAMSWYKLRDML
jgi:gamma-glutamylputrescine oxidase